MKTLFFGSLMGLFGAFAVYISLAFNMPAWVLFLAWVCFYFYGKLPKRIINIYLQIVLGIILSALIEISGEILSTGIGNTGRYLAIFFFVGSLAYLIKIRGLHDLTAWFLGFVTFFGTGVEVSFIPLLRTLLIPLASGFILGYLVDFIVIRFIHNDSAEQAHN
jgi:hypothetical protein